MLLVVLQVLVLENVRFYKEEEKNDPTFSKSVSPRISYTLEYPIP